MWCGYTVGNRHLQAAYRGVLRILDTTSTASATLPEVGYFDVDPASNASGYSGTWMVLPYLKNGVVPVQSIGVGLFLVRPHRQPRPDPGPGPCPGGVRTSGVQQRRTLRHLRRLPRGADSPADRARPEHGDPAGHRSRRSSHRLSAGTHQPMHVRAA
jgi:hypothetical protein